MNSTSPSQTTGWLLSTRGWATLLALYWITLFALTHWPGNPIVAYRQGTSTDKLAHTASYAVLALLVAWVVWLARRGTTRPWGVWHAASVWLGLAFYGALDELTQPLTGRHCDFYDWVADVVGVTLGLAFFSLVALGLRSKPDSAPPQ